MSARFAKGTSCTFAGITEQTFCPFCQKGLDDSNAEVFQHSIEAFERGEYEWATYSKIEQPVDWKPRPHPGYVKMMAWALSENRCFRHPVHIRNSFRKHTGVDVDITL